MTTPERTLGLGDVFAIAAGAMISSGLFVLPGVVYAQVGPSMILAYALAGLLNIPTLLAQAELSTAMPKSAGSYFAIERSLGAYMGTIAGLINWIALGLKAAFALVGIGTLAVLVWPDGGEWAVKGAAIVAGLAFTGINLVSVKETGRLQNLLVFGLFGILAAYLFSGLPAMTETRFIPFFTAGPQAFLATVGMVFVSYGGIAAVMDVGGEVREPAKNVPRGMFLAFGAVNLLYILVALVTVGVLEGETLGGSLRPVADGAYALWGQTGLIVIGIGSLLAYATTGNAGILSASRSPLAMSHDGLLPARFSRIHPRYGTPTVAVLVTSSMMMLVVAFLSVEDLVKTASTMLLISLVLINVSVIVMRHSRIASYAPTFRMPLCPWLPGAAILLYLFLIAEMGLVPLLVTSAFLAAASIWYIAYVQPRIDRESAAAYLVKSILSRHIARSGLENELVHISLERDAVEMDRFDRLVKDAPILDIAEPIDGETLFARISDVMAPRLNREASAIKAALLDREREASTVIQPGLAIPHVIVDGKDVFDLALVRCRSGASFSPLQAPVHTAFVLIGSRDQRSYHLRALVAIAHVVQGKEFQARWMSAKNAEQLRDIVLLTERERHGQ